MLHEALYEALSSWAVVEALFNAKKLDLLGCYRKVSSLKLTWMKVAASLSDHLSHVSTGETVKNGTAIYLWQFLSIAFILIGMMQFSKCRLNL